MMRMKRMLALLLAMMMLLAVPVEAVATGGDYTVQYVVSASHSDSGNKTFNNVSRNDYPAYGEDPVPKWEGSVFAGLCG